MVDAEASRIDPKSSHADAAAVGTIFWMESLYALTQVGKWRCWRCQFTVQDVRRAEAEVMQRQKTVLLITCLVLIAAVQAIAQLPGDIDWDRARQLRQRSLRGETLKEEEQSYLQRAIELRQKQRPQQRRLAEIKPPVGLKPLTELTGDDHYKD